MSFTQPDQAPIRLNRSQLSVPGIRPELFEKAAKSAADVILLDLEDSVAPDDKPHARRSVIDAIGDVDWGAKTLSVRVNGMDTPFFYRDVIDILEQASDRLDLLMVPKAGTREDVYAVDFLVTQVEMALGRTRKIGLELQIESALGLANVEAVAAAGPRSESLHFGSGDLGATVGVRTVHIGGDVPDYAVRGESGKTVPGDIWHYPLMRMVVAARAAGLRPVDGPYSDFNDPEGLEIAARRAAAMGCDGKWAIHPSQIEPINAIFSPGDDEVAEARALLDAWDAAAKAGRGAATHEGKMIDVANVRQARALVAKAELIAKRG